MPQSEGSFGVGGDEDGAGGTDSVAFVDKTSSSMIDASGGNAKEKGNARDEVGEEAAGGDIGVVDGGTKSLRVAVGAFFDVAGFVADTVDNASTSIGALTRTNRTRPYQYKKFRTRIAITW